MLTDDPRLRAIVDAHRRRTGDADVVLLSALLLAEEAGEAVQQVRRLMGHARQQATTLDVAAELADVVISAAILARLLDVDLDRAIDEKLAIGVR
jgi:NTP pyrophosphatase (non-canonical NTP hydrolase)